MSYRSLIGSRLTQALGNHFFSRLARLSALGSRLTLPGAVGDDKILRVWHERQQYDLCYFACMQLMTMAAPGLVDTRCSHVASASLLRHRLRYQTKDYAALRRRKGCGGRQVNVLLHRCLNSVNLPAHPLPSSISRHPTPISHPC
jgi:hypothetical protein